MLTVSDISRLVVAWVSAQQRHYRQSTRGIATVEQRLEWEREAEAIIAAHDREVAAKALRDAADDWHAENSGTAPRMHRWLRDRADQIEAVADDYH